MIHEIDPKRVLVATPSHSGKVETGYAAGLASVFSSHYAGGISFLVGNSDVGAARCSIAHQFLANTNFDWLICIDDDIHFSAKDFGLLMTVEPDPREGEFAGAKYSRLGDTKGELVPVGKGGVGEYKWNPELAVVAEYSKKVESLDPVRFGMGFVRLHRSVFEKIAAMDFASDHPNSGQPVVEQFMCQGTLMHDFFPMMTMGDGRRPGEDGGFWTLVKLAGIVPRIEQRTRLVHWGRQGFPYQKDVMGAQ